MWSGRFARCRTWSARLITVTSRLMATGRFREVAKRMRDLVYCLDVTDERVNVQETRPTLAGCRPEVGHNSPKRERPCVQHAVTGAASLHCWFAFSEIPIGGRQQGTTIPSMVSLRR